MRHLKLIILVVLSVLSSAFTFIPGGCGSMAPDSEPQTDNQPPDNQPPQTQAPQERCSGVAHGTGQSYIWACFDGYFLPGDTITVQFLELGIIWQMTISSSLTCICTDRQTIYSYGTYSYSGNHSTSSGESLSFNGSIPVTSSERDCTCP